MLNYSDIKKRILSFMVVLVLTVSQSGYFALFEVYGDSDSSRSEATVAVLAFTSDVHNKKENRSANRLGAWMDNIKSIYGRIDAMGFCGDMAGAHTGTSYWSYVRTMMQVAESRVNAVVYTTGNHEYSHEDNASEYEHDLNDCTEKIIEDDVGLDQNHYIIYSLGSSSYRTHKKTNMYSLEQINELAAYLAGIGNERPIIIITHYPLHFYGSRTIRNADMLIDTLNNAAVGDPDDATDDKKIVFLWGHNHSESDVHYDQIFEPGDSISYSSGNCKTIRFFYGSAGCMSDKEYSSGSANVKGKGLVITIDCRHRLTFTYYNENGIDVTEDGQLTELDSASNISTFVKSGVLIPCMTSEGVDKLNIVWGKVRGAEGYDVFLGECKNQMVLSQSVKGNQWTADGLKAHTPYMAVVKAYITENGVKTYIRTSPTIHAYTSGGTKKYTNPKAVTVKKSKVKIKAGKTYKIKAKVKKLKKRRKLIGKGHARKLRYISNNTSVATVNRSGKIKAMAKGSCMIYVYAVNGVHKAITVTVY